jgi:stage III sporulation protein AB
MLKMAGAILVCLSSALTGYMLAGGLTARVRSLQALLVGLQNLETEIHYGATPLPEALREVARRCGPPTAALFETAARYLGDPAGYTAGEAWQRALEEWRGEAHLRASEAAILNGLGTCLGRSDREDQVKHLRLAREQLGLCLARAEEEAARGVKLWSYLGLTAGPALVLLLL